MMCGTGGPSCYETAGRMYRSLLIALSPVLQLVLEVLVKSGDYSHVPYTSTSHLSQLRVQVESIQDSSIYYSVRLLLHTKKASSKSVLYSFQFRLCCSKKKIPLHF